MWLALSKMASRAQEILLISREIDILKMVKDGIKIAEDKVNIGVNMSQEDYNVMYLTAIWVEAEIARLTAK